MFNFALRLDAITRNPVVSCSRLRKPPTTPRALTPEQVDSVRAAVRDWRSSDAVHGPKPDGLVRDLIEVLAMTPPRAALDHEPGAFARLFDRHRDAVFRQALRMMSQPADAEEVASAAFFELWRKQASVVLVNGSVRPWLLATTANLARNSHRIRLRREAFLRTLPREPDDGGRDAFERIDDDVVRRDLVNALKRLTPQDAALVTMTALDAYRVGEVAGLLGLTEGDARVRLHRAHARLRNLLTPADEHSDPQEVAR